MDKNLLDNMSGQELKEMINDEIIALEELDNAALEKIMNFEIDMLCYGTGDMTIIRRCSELLNKINDSDLINRDRVISIINKVQQEHVIIVDGENINESEAKVIRKKHITLRRVGLVAAIIATLMSVTVLVAAAFGVNIFEYISEFVRNNGNSVVNINGITFHNGGEAKRYSSVEEMLELEKLNIMYPSKLPEGINISSIIINKDEHGDDIIHISTNDENIYIAMDTKSESNVDSYVDCIIYESNGIKYYIIQDTTFFAICYYNNVRYSIQANNYDELIFIIDNMKE